VVFTDNIGENRESAWSETLMLEVFASLTITVGR
jgi:hypothetical protein